MRLVTTIFALIIIGNIYAQSTVYQDEDSARIECILNRLDANCSTTGEIVLAVANEFLGTPYIAGTLDRDEAERLTVNTREMDCTTFMEQVVAIVLTHRQNRKTFHAFCENLEKIRYKGGVCNGYTSRLHYISQWIADEAKNELLYEVVGKAHTATQKLNLDFMSKHPDSYKQLKEQPELVSEINEQESPFRGVKIKYIPKQLLNKSHDILNIRDGDILALVTSIEGLDVSHVGFAFWKDGALHLLHASSGKGYVIADESTLYEYQMKRKSHLGVRVFRIL